MISDKEIRKRAKSVLRTCPRLQRLCGDIHTLKSVTLSDMPKNVSKINHTENITVSQIDRLIEAQNQLQAIREALDRLSTDHREILIRVYITQYDKTQQYIADEMAMALKTLQSHLRIALVEFAEAYHYENLFI